MSYRVLIISLCATIISTINSIYAQQNGGFEVDIRIYFKYDDANIDPEYMGNKKTLQTIDSLLLDSIYLATIRNIEITAQSSPEGGYDYNSKLSKCRKSALKELFTERYPQVGADVWSFNSISENWRSFQRNLAARGNLPSREEVLAIAYSNREPDAKEWLLRELDNGKPWRYIKKKVLPRQRFGAEVIFVPMTIDHMAKPTHFEVDRPKPKLPKYTPMQSDESKLIMAIKSNLLLDALTMINLAVEIPIGKRWSVVGEVIYPWWSSSKHDFTMQVESYHAEAKYWLGNRETKEQLQGWSIGLYGGWGRYDIQPFRSTGAQGTLLDVGAQIGFSHPIARSLNLEYTLGVGYLSTDYESYEMARNTSSYGDIKVIPYPWMKSSLSTIFPTRCGVSLVWLIKSRRVKRW